MDMDLVITFAFVTTIILIITTGIVVFPMMRKLGHFLEEAARERARDRLAGEATASLPAGGHEELLHALGNLDQRIAELAERQTFTEELLSERAQARLETGQGDADEG